MRLTRRIGSDTSVTESDTLSVKAALQRLGLYATPRYGMTPYPDEAMIAGLKAVQTRLGREATGSIRPGGPEEAVLGRALADNSGGGASGVVHVRSYEQSRDGQEVQVSDYVRRAPGNGSGLQVSAPGGSRGSTRGGGVGPLLDFGLGGVLGGVGSLLDFALEGISDAAGSLAELAEGGNVMTDAWASFLGSDALPPNLRNVDMSFIQIGEGTRLKAYFPEGGPALFPRSGATVGVGVDLGQMNATDLADLVKNHGLDPALAQKLSPYLGKQGVEAAEFIRTHDLTLSKAEARNLTLAKLSSLYGRLEANFNRAQAAMGSKIRFADLPKEARTVAFSVGMQYGEGLNKTAPKFWQALISRDWAAMDTELRLFKDIHYKRREKEADYLKSLLPPR